MKKHLPKEHRRGLLLGLMTTGLMAALVVLPLQFPSTASINDQNAVQEKREGRENYDIRTDKSAAPTLAGLRAQAGLTQGVEKNQQQTMLAAEASLRKRLPALKVEYNPLLRVPEVISTAVSDESNALQQSKTGGRPDVLLSFLKANNNLVSLTDNQVDELQVTADYTNPAQNLSFIRLEQSINGIPVFAGEVNAGFDKNGRLFRVINNLAPGLEYESLSENFGDPSAAVEQAFKHVDREITPDDTQLNAAVSSTNKVVFGKEEDETPTTAERMYFPLDTGVARAAWRVLIWEDVAGYYVIIDAETGTILWRKNLTDHQTQPATYNVYVANNMVKTADNPAPLTPGPTAPDGTQAPPIPRTNVTLVGNEPGYEFNSLGWIPDGADTTEGNNARAGLDRTAPDGIDALVVGQITTTGGITTRIFNFNYLPAPNPAPSPAPTFPNLPLNEPLNDSYQRGAVTQLFYTTNRWHDEMYRLGFTEQARNFQQNNFGRGGLGNDRVLAQAQDYSGTNNANFLTPADGTPGRMQMYLWPVPDPDRDGDLDAEIVIHELTHGTSTRLHNQALTTNHAGGMGEGWGDFYAHTMLSEPTDPIEGIYTTGGYSTYRGNGAGTYVDNYYYGIRKFPKAVISFVGPNGKPHNPLSFRHLNANCNTEIGIGINPISAYPRNPFFGSTTCDQVHAAGEIWSSALWEVRAKYIQRLGHTEGTRRVLQHVTDGMKLAPRPPTFLSERDAIIAAAQAGGEQADVDDLWAGFALRGMGFSARIISISPANVVEAFDLPNVVQSPDFTFTDENGNNNGFAEPGETLTLTIPLTNNTNRTISNVTLEVVSGGTADYGDIAAGATVSRTVSFTVPANAPCGSLLTLTLNINSSQGPRVETRELRIGQPGPAQTIENFDNVTAPALPAGWQETHTGGNTGWRTTTTAPNSPPNALYAPDPDVSGYAEVTSPAINVPSTTAQLRFRNNYNTEETWDGTVLEISIGGGPYQDILAAGGRFDRGGYNSGFATAAGHVLSGREAWTGNSGGYIDTIIDLPASANGQAVSFRWRTASDTNTGGEGTWIDDIQLVSEFVCTPVSTSLIVNPSFEQGDAPWEDWGNSIVVANPNAPNGSFELQIGTGQGGRAQTVSVTANTIYTLSAVGRVSQAGETGWIGVFYLDAAGNQVAPQSLIDFNSTTYEQKQLNVQTTAETTQLRVWTWKNSGEGYFYVDNIILTKP